MTSDRGRKAGLALSKRPSWIMKGIVPWAKAAMRISIVRSLLLTIMKTESKMSAKKCANADDMSRD